MCLLNKWDWCVVMLFTIKSAIFQLFSTRGACLLIYEDYIKNKFRYELDMEVHIWFYAYNLHCTNVHSE